MPRGTWAGFPWGEECSPPCSSHPRALGEACSAPRATGFWVKANQGPQGSFWNAGALAAHVPSVGQVHAHCRPLPPAPVLSAAKPRDRVLTHLCRQSGWHGVFMVASPASRADPGPPRGHGATFGDLWDGNDSDRGATGVWWLKSKGAAKGPDPKESSGPRCRWPRTIQDLWVLPSEFGFLLREAGCCRIPSFGFQGALSGNAGVNAMISSFYR